MTLLRRSWLLFLSVTLHAVASAQRHEVGDGSFGPVKAAHVATELKAGNPAGSLPLPPIFLSTHAPVIISFCLPNKAAAAQS
jgi:hypothetical protein